MSIDQLTEFFKWMTIINICLLFFSTFAVMIFKPLMLSMHSKMFGISEAQLSVTTYAYLGLLKALIIVFSIVPYIALLIIKN